MESRIEYAVRVASRFLPIEDCGRGIGRVMFKKDYVYATDGRIAVRIRVDGGGFADCGNTRTNIIDCLCNDMRNGGVRLPRQFRLAFTGAWLAGEWGREKNRLRSLRVADLRDIVKIPCPHCGKELYYDTCLCELVSDEEYHRKQRAAYGKIDEREVSMFVRLDYAEVENPDDIQEVREKCSAINYWYGRLMVETVGDGGTYLHGRNCRVGRDGECFYGISQDGSVEVVIAGATIESAAKSDRLWSVDCWEKGGRP